MTTTPPSPDRIQGVMTGFWASKALFTGVELGVFKELSRGPASAEVLAYRLKLNPKALERLMNALVSLTLLEKKGGRFSNTPEAETFLVEGKPEFVGGQVEHLAHLHWRLWENLPDAVRENSPRVRQVFGPGFDIFQAISADPQRLRAFVQGMHNLTMPAAEELVDAFDLTPYHTLMDVGGGSGALCIAAVKRYPNLKGIVLELPAVCPITQDFVERHGMKDRVQVRPGDFFDTKRLPSDADAIALGWVLHDWPATEARAVLKNCYEALRPGGVLLLCEKLLDEDKAGPMQTTLMDLHLLVSTGGEERSASEYKTWMESAGFQGVSTRVLRGNRDLVVGHKR
ncbi:MAG: methyltransferase domain-containing protein [Dehalococcoidia bacterium]|nr:methyltransferase domain-containing protein [Dehalococcoidia bacterium]